MFDVTTNRTGSKLAIEIDLSQAGSPSKMGRMMTVIASTQGNVKLEDPGDLVAGLKVYKPSAQRTAA
jgi:hypothetical protein